MRDDTKKYHQRRCTKVLSLLYPHPYPFKIPSHRFSPSLRNDGALNEFVDGLGPGQLVGRQVLGAPSLGDIQLSLCHQKGCLEVEVIRARGLQVRRTHSYSIL